MVGPVGCAGTEFEKGGFTNEPGAVQFSHQRPAQSPSGHHPDLLDLVRGFFVHRIFGPNRDALLVATQADEPIV